MIFAVGDEQHRLARLAAPAALEDFPGFIESVRDGGPLRGHADGCHGAQEQPGGGVIGGQRALDERVAREHHQADPISLQPIEQRRHFQLRALDPRGLHIARQHAVRRVQRHDQIDPGALHQLRPLATLQAGGGDEEEEESKPEQRTLRDALAGTAALDHVPESRTRDERRDALLALPGSDGRQHTGDQPQGRNPEQERREHADVLAQQGGLDPRHGAPCMRVPRRATPRSPKSAAGTKKRAYHSS